MAVVLKDRVRGWTNAVGEDAFNISADASGYQAFSVIGDGNQTYYTCFDPNTGAWEVGIGTYTAATNSLSRDTILSSSNSNAKVVFLPNQKELFVGYPAERAVATDLPATLTNKTIQSSTLNSSPVGASSPSTGAFTTLTATAASVTSANMAVALVTTGTVTNLTATSASIASANIGTAVITNFVIEGISVNSANFNYAKITSLVATGASIASANAVNLQVTGASIASANVGTAVITTGTVTNLTATGASVASANVGVALITTGTVTSLTATGASIASANVGTAVITTGTVTNLTVTGASVASANFGNVVTTTERVTNFSATSASIASANAAVALITTGTVTNLTATGASIASANLGNAVITSMTLTGASVASANVGVAVVTDLRVVGASITSANVGTAVVTGLTVTGASIASANFGVGVFAAGTAAAPSITTTGDTNNGIFFPAADTTAITTGGSERLRVDSSGNVGIGTASPNFKEEVNQGSGSGAPSLLQTPQLVLKGWGGGGTFHSGIGFSMSEHTAGYWGSGILEIDDSGSYGAALGFYTSTGAASASPTEKMRISSSGNVGIGGTTDAYQKVAVKGTLPTSSAISQGIVMQGTVPSGSTGGSYGFGSYLNTQAASFTDGAHYYYFAYQNSIGAGSAVTNQYGYYADASLTGATNNYGFYSAIASASNRWNFYAAGTAKNYFAGDVLIATTGLPVANGVLSISSSGNAARLYGTTTGTAAFCIDKSANDSTTGQVFAIFTINTQGTGSGQINANGASQAAFGTFSDRRLKQNIVEIESQWNNFKALRPVKFDYIESEGGGHQIGFIAQEIESVYPDLVGRRSDQMLTLTGMGKNEARMIKALQEAMLRIEQLESKVAALEA